MKPILIPCLLVLIASACATVPRPTATLSAAGLAVQRADQSRAGDPSAPELRAARIKLAAANDAVRRGEMLLATRLAEEARLDAELAAARSESARALFEADAMKKTNEGLRQQALRSSVNVAPIPIPEAIPVPTTDTPTTGNH